MPIWYVVIVAGLLYVLLEFTATGRHMRAVGGNRAAAELAGISSGRAVAVAFIIGGLISALAAIVSGSQLDQGRPLLLPVIFCQPMLRHSLARPRSHRGVLTSGVPWLVSTSSALASPDCSNSVSHLGCRISLTAPFYYLLSPYRDI
jgi:Branched-chain amino acid transport system / permease component